ncbi:MAG TPA: hypothetical protein VKZ50_21060 [bacterium]|nr:hypothetical protein [bacterium]
MDRRSLRILTMGILIGALSSAVVLGALAAIRGRSAGAGVRGDQTMILTVRSVQNQVPAQSPFTTPREFVPIPNPRNGDSIGPGQPSPGAGGNTPGSQQPSAGGGGQDCPGKVLFLYQGRLYQLNPGPMPPNGGNPEFFFMQPYQGPQIPGFPEQTPSQGPIPGLPSIPPTFKF